MVTKLNFATAMNAKISGSGNQTLVLAHGYGGDQSIWDKVLPLLAERYRVLSFDWCFSGAIKSESFYDSIRYSSYDAFADDLIGLVDEMKVKSSVFVGHSMSGMIGCIASIKKPDLFHRLVLVGATPRLLNMEDYQGGFQMLDIEQIFTNIETNYLDWALKFASLVVDPADPPSVAIFHDCLKRMRPEIALPLAKTVFLGDYRNILDKVVVPCNIIQTTNDIIVPEEVAMLMKSKIKGDCEVHFIDTLGHFPQLTAPNQFVEVFVRVLDLEK